METQSLRVNVVDFDAVDDPCLFILSYRTTLAVSGLVTVWSLATRIWYCGARSKNRVSAVSPIRSDQATVLRSSGYGSLALMMNMSTTYTPVCL